MKRTQIYFRLLLITVVLLQLTACKKIEQAILKDPCSDIKFCNVQSYVYPGAAPYYSDPNTATFTYDALGNPLAVNNTRVGTGIPNLVFKYDASHRLTEFQRPYSNGLFEQWFKYVYDASGKIIADTSYVFGTITPSWPPTGSHQRRYTTYTYDNTCRVIKTTTIGIGGPEDGFPPNVFTYSYDATGNLIRPGITYDDKVNIHRTNKIFMFVDSDFSMNNPYTAPGYNGYGLPQIAGSATSGAYFLARPVANAAFAYECDTK
jgi:hypothetical protein